MFKVGDRVVFTDKSVGGSAGYPEVGARGEVERIFNDGIIVQFDVDQKLVGSLFADRFVLEEVYNSPLYQALKEE